MCAGPADVPKLSISSDPIAGRQFAELIIGFFLRIPHRGRCHGIDYHQAKEILLKTIFDTRGNLCHAHTHTVLAPSGRSLFFSQAGGDDNFPKQLPTHTHTLEHTDTSWMLAAVANDEATKRKLSFGRALSHFYFLPLFFVSLEAN